MLRATATRLAAPSIYWTTGETTGAGPPFHRGCPTLRAFCEGWEFSLMLSSFSQCANNRDCKVAPVGYAPLQKTQGWGSRSGADAQGWASPPAPGENRTQLFSESALPRPLRPASTITCLRWAALVGTDRAVCAYLRAPVAPCRLCRVRWPGTLLGRRDSARGK